MLMAKLFQELLRHGKQNFEVVFLVMDPGYSEENVNLQTVIAYKDKGIKHSFLDTYDRI